MKYFIKTKIVPVFFFLMTINLFAQKSNSKIIGGVYLTYADLLKGKITNPVYKGNGKITKNNLTEVLKLKINDSTITYNMGDVFGYIDGKEKFRYAKSLENPLYNGYFKFKEVSQFIVYEKTVYHKSTKGSKLKGPIKHVFFSKEVNSAIKELNFNNLSDEFRNVPEVLYWVNKIGAKCNSCLTKKTRNGYNITNQINNYNKRSGKNVGITF
jgi:hypothetical protein